MHLLGVHDRPFCSCVFACEAAFLRKGLVGGRERAREGSSDLEVMMGGKYAVYILVEI